MTASSEPDPTSGTVIKVLNDQLSLLTHVNITGVQHILQHQVWSKCEDCEEGGAAKR